jgi:hypothetical protein
VGGAGDDFGYGIVLDPDGGVHIAGYTDSAQDTFPVLVGPSLVANGGYEAFVAKVHATGASLEYCGYIGGSGDDFGYALAMGGDGNLCVAGATDSDHFRFPVAVGPDLVYNGGLDAFAAKYDPTTTEILWCGYIGGTGDEAANAVAIDSRGDVVIAGETTSTEATFPVITGPDLTANGDVDVFVARVAASGERLHYCGYIGGDLAEYAYGVAVDASDRALVTGYTWSTDETFPVMGGPDLTHNGERDAFLARLPIVLDCAAGRVDLGASTSPADVLTVNASSGDPWRTVRIPAGRPIEVFMNVPPGGPDPAAFALYAWLGEPSPGTVTPHPLNLGDACFPTPLSGGTPAPTKIWNNIGKTALLGDPDFPSDPAPSVVFHKASGLAQPVTVTFQGFLLDDGSSATKPASITNAVILEVE